MMISKKALPRRTFLRGVGATVALPLLDAMVPSMTALAKTAATPVRRLGFVYVPMGSNISMWTPPGEGGALTQLSPSLGPLATVKDQLTVVNRIFQVFQKSEIENFILSRAKSCNFVATPRILMFLGAQRYISNTLDRLRAFAGACGDDFRSQSH